MKLNHAASVESKTQRLHSGPAAIPGERLWRESEAERNDHFAIAAGKILGALAAALVLICALAGCATTGSSDGKVVAKHYEPAWEDSFFLDGQLERLQMPASYVLIYSDGYQVLVSEAEYNAAKVPVK
jgi:hypothetical protein